MLWHITKPSNCFCVSYGTCGAITPFTIYWRTIETSTFKIALDKATFTRACGFKSPFSAAYRRIIWTARLWNSAGSIISRAGLHQPSFRAYQKLQPIASHRIAATDFYTLRKKIKFCFRTSLINASTIPVNTIFIETNGIRDPAFSSLTSCKARY